MFMVFETLFPDGVLLVLRDHLILACVLRVLRFLRLHLCPRLCTYHASVYVDASDIGLIGFMHLLGAVHVAFPLALRPTILGHVSEASTAVATAIDGLATGLSVAFAALMALGVVVPTLPLYSFDPLPLPFMSMPYHRPWGWHDLEQHVLVLHTSSMTFRPRRPPSVLADLPCSPTMLHHDMQVHGYDVQDLRTCP